MKAILTFNLYDPDDRENHSIILQARQYLTALNEIQALLRKKTKYNENEVECEILEKFSDEFHEILFANDIKL